MMLTEKERKSIWLVIGAFFVFVAAYVFRDKLYVVPHGEHYLTVHTILEFFSITVSFAIAIQGLMLFPQHLSRHRLWISGTFLAIGLIDLFHTLSYQGMPGLIVTESSTQKATWFWITARLTQAILLFFVLLFPDKPVKRYEKGWVTIVALFYVTILSFVVIQYEQQLPHLVIEGVGTTTLKNQLEYFVCFLKAATILSLFLSYRKHKKPSALDLMVAFAFLLFSELAFTLYKSVYDLQNLLGHIYKVAGYIYFMKGIYIATIQEPFEARQQAEKALQQSERRLRAITASLGEGVVVLNREQKAVFLNEEAVRLLGYRKEELLGQNMHEKIHYRKIDGSPFPAEECPIRNTVETKQTIRVEEDYFIRKDDTMLPVSYVAAPMMEEGELAGVVVAFQDITERKQYHEKIKYQAYHDALTGLPNRHHFIEHVKTELEKAKRTNGKLAILYLDLDNFKNVNDSFGHVVGDLLLQQVANRLASTHPHQFVSRLGGDEFAIVFPVHSVSAEIVAEQTIQTLVKPIGIEGKELFVTTSIGICLYPDDGETEMDLILHADMAMYEAKKKGKNQFLRYTKQLEQRRARNLLIERLLHTALEQKEITLYYQPIVDTSLKKTVGLEALVRWHHPDVGFISPSEFIPIAEENGLIVPIGEYVLRTACEHLSELQHSGFTDLYMSVNLSLRQLQHEQFLSFVQQLLHDIHVHPHHIELEITETIALSDDEHVIRTIQALKQLGFRIAIDDFGSGYSSIGYLKQFTIDTLKIDKSFVFDVINNDATARLTAAVITLGHSLGLQIVAEGVESTDHLSFLNKHRCDRVQGYLFSPPIPFGQLSPLLQQRVNV